MELKKLIVAKSWMALQTGQKLQFSESKQEVTSSETAEGGGVLAVSA